MFHEAVWILLVVLCCAALLALVYIVTSKQFEDRVVGANLVCTIVINIIAVLAVYLNASFVVDVCLVFAFLGFLAVVVLCRLMAVQRLEKRLKAREEEKAKGGGKK